MFEFGSPEDPKAAEELLACSPYHQIQDTVEYPAILVLSGDSDTRCDPMHARKLVARLQRTISRFPILLRYTRRRGHTGTSPLVDRIESLTDQIYFLFTELCANPIDSMKTIEEPWQ
jgi:prolyl oligopeptidase